MTQVRHSAASDNKKNHSPADANREILQNVDYLN